MLLHAQEELVRHSRVQVVNSDFRVPPPQVLHAAAVGGAAADSGHHEEGVWGVHPGVAAGYPHTLQTAGAGEQQMTEVMRVDCAAATVVSHVASRALTRECS